MQAVVIIYCWQSRVEGLQITVGHQTLSNQIWQMSEQNQIVMVHHVIPNKIYCLNKIYINFSLLPGWIGFQDWYFSSNLLIHIYWYWLLIYMSKRTLSHKQTKQLCQTNSAIVVLCPTKFKLCPTKIVNWTDICLVEKKYLFAVLWDDS